MLNSDRRRMPFSTPLTTEMVASTTTRPIRITCTERLSGTSNM